MGFFVFLFFFEVSFFNDGKDKPSPPKTTRKAFKALSAQGSQEGFGRLGQPLLHQGSVKEFVEIGQEERKWS